LPLILIRILVKEKKEDKHAEDTYWVIIYLSME